MDVTAVPESRQEPSPLNKPAAKFGISAERREIIAGMLIVVGLCWPFLFSSIANVVWWFFPPFAILAGFLRRVQYPRAKTPFIPLWSFFLVLILFGIYGYTVDPMPAIGEDKLLHFAMLAAAGYLGACGQKPLSEPLIRGMRQMLLVTFLISLLVAYKRSNMFLNAESEGLETLRQAFAITAFPLVIALGATCMVTAKLAPLRLLASGALLLGGAAFEIFVRGRYDAIMLVVLAAMVVLGPPMKQFAFRLALAGLLLALGLAIYVSVLPQMGDSFRYLQATSPESLGGRSGIFDEAIQGFLTHPFGQGIGSFSRVEPMLGYPHNIILECAFEMGILGLLSILSIYALVFTRVCQFWLSPPHRIMGALLLLLFAHMLKAGDIAMLAFPWVYLYLLFVATPLDRSWLLVKDEG